MRNRGKVMARSTAWRAGRNSSAEWLRNRGFTLLELMIVVVIIAILAAIAYPSYISYITKTKRSAAEGCLSEYANYMERYYTTNLTYAGAGAVGTWPTLDCASPSQTGNDYGYALGPAPGSSTNTYQLTATPQGSQSVRDTQCGTLTLNQAGARGAAGIVDTTGTNPAVVACWKG